MRRVVLGAEVDRAAFEDAARSHEDWTLHRIAGPDETEPYVETWVVGDGQTAVHYLEDDLLALNYVMVTGPASYDLAAALADELDTISAPQALDLLAASSSADERADALAYLAVAAEPGEGSPALLEAFRSGLDDPDPGVRRVAVAGSAYLDWPALDSLLERSVSDDPDPDVRRFAEQALTAIRANRAGGPR